MALDKEKLKCRIVEEMKEQGASTVSEYSWLCRFAEAMSIAIVDEIQENAEIGGGESGESADGSGGGGIT